MKEQLIKATIEKSIGNSFIIKVDGEFYNIVTWKAASKLIDCRPVLADTVELLQNPVEIEVSAKKQMTDEAIAEATLYQVKWVDRNKSLQDVIKEGVLSGSKIIIQSHVFRDGKKKGTGFVELENPKIKFYLIIDGLDVNVSRPIFMHYSSNVQVVEKRSI
jgi:hypothetical protein